MRDLFSLAADGILAVSIWIVVLAIFTSLPTKRSTSSKLPDKRPLAPSSKDKAP